MPEHLKPQELCGVHVEVRDISMLGMKTQVKENLWFYSFHLLEIQVREQNRCLTSMSAPREACGSGLRHV